MSIWSRMLRGASTGAGAGATAGSFLPGLGTALGAGVGGLLGGTIGAFTGSKKGKTTFPSTGGNKGIPTGQMPTTEIPGYESGRIQEFTPEQMQLFQQMFGQVGPESYLSKLAGGDPSMFEELEAPALRQFGELQSNIASRYSQGGARRSSGFQHAQTGAAQDFAQQLQAQRLGLQRDARRDLALMRQELLGQRPYESYILPQQQGFWSSLASGLAPGVGSFLGQLGGQAASKYLF